MVGELPGGRSQWLELLSNFSQRLRQLRNLAKRKDDKEKVGDAQARSMSGVLGGGPCTGDHGPSVSGWKREEGRVDAQEQYRGGKRLRKKAKGRAFKKRRGRESDRGRERKLSVDRSGDPSA